MPLHLSFFEDGVDLKFPVRCPVASDPHQLSGKGSLVQVVHQKSSGQPEHSRGISTSNGEFLELHSPYFDIYLLS